MNPSSSTPRIVIPGEAHAALGMAAFVGLGGLFAGYRGANKSMAISFLYAAGYATAGNTIRKGDGVMGHGGAAVLGAFLTVSMGIRFAATRKVFPPAVLGTTALLSTLYHSYKFYQWKF